MAAVARCRCRRLRSARGAELVEFALVMPLLLLMLAALLDVGFLINNYAIVTNAAREGARLASIPGWSTEDVEARVNEYIGGAGLPTDGVDTDVDFNFDIPVGGRTIKAVRVFVAYPYDYLLLDSIIETFSGEEFSSLTLKAAATMRTEVAAGL
jgi:hypothetical protein